MSEMYQPSTDACKVLSRAHQLVSTLFAFVVKDAFLSSEVAPEPESESNDSPHYSNLIYKLHRLTYPPQDTVEQAVSEASDDTTGSDETTTESNNDLPLHLEIPEIDEENDVPTASTLAAHEVESVTSSGYYRLHTPPDVTRLSPSIVNPVPSTPYILCSAALLN
mmetsp:Transcript_6422/g.20065  ORF Transcript_6422/g.20065 Transcript_6422/m.20065 type:complete len:165 (+) Transcript_6422:912-1406(+)